MLHITIPRDQADVYVHVAYVGEEELDCNILEVHNLKDAPHALRLHDVAYALESGIVVYLWWEDDTGESLILPLEGRGRLDLAPLGGISNPRREGCTGHVRLTTRRAGEGLKSFFLALEFSKIRE